MLKRFFNRVKQFAWSSVLFPSNWGSWSFGTESSEKLVEEAYKKNPIVFAAVNFKANSASKVHLNVFRNGKLLEEEDPAVRLIQKPNPLMNEADLWRYIIVDLSLFGCSAWQKVRNQVNKPAQLWRLRPDWLQAVVTEDAIVWKYQTGSEVKTFPMEDVVYFHLYDPLYHLNALAPAKVVYPLVALDNAITNFQYQYLSSGGLPPIVLKLKGFIQPEQIQRLRERWSAQYGGMRNWSMPAVLDGDADIEKLGTSFEEFDFSDMDSKLESRICAVFGVSPILLNLPGGLERSTFSNYEQALRTFWTNVLIPQMEDILDVVQNQILSEFDATGEWDYSRIMVLQNDFQDMLDVLLKACQNGIITVNEFRQYLDMEGFEQDERLSPMLKQMDLESRSSANPEETKKASKSNSEPLKPSEEELNAYIRKAQDLIAEPLEQFWQEELPKTERNFLQWAKKVETP